MSVAISENKSSTRVIISQGYSAEIVEKIRWLFVEYQESVGVTLSFQDFQGELMQLPEPYTPPSGRLIFAKSANEFIGCIGLEKLTNRICEIKRWYVKPQFRKQNIGCKLLIQAMEEARLSGYHNIQLEILPSMKEAIRICLLLGFRKNPVEEKSSDIPGKLYFIYSLKTKI